MKTKRRRYSLKRLRDLWIVWVDENHIRPQEFFEKYNLEGSFVHWLEKREKGA